MSSIEHLHNTVHCMDCLDVMKTLPDNSIDAVVTDPPYGLSFMGKKWDYDVPSQEIWEECLRVLKPGGYLLAFAGTRTQHRMAVRIEDAGFEIRDMIAWVYGSGFPKSLNIGKQIEKSKRGNRVVKLINALLEEGHTLKELGEKVGIPSLESSYRDWTTDHSPEERSWERLLNGLGFSEADGLNIIEKRKVKLGGGNAYTFREGQDREWEMKITKGTSEWEGWGTALKPSLESITLAQKTLDFRSLLDILIRDNLYILKKELCQFPALVSIAEKSLMGNQQGGEDESRSIAQWIAEKHININEDLPVVIDMLQYQLTENTNLNIVLGWLDILVDLYNQMNTYTTETKKSLTIDLKTLSLLEFESIYQNIIQVKGNQINGLNANVYNAELLFKGLQLKLKTIQEHFAQESVISKVAANSHEGAGLTPNLSPIIMSRKPLSEKTVAENCLKWGVGGINIDGCRVGLADGDDTKRATGGHKTSYIGGHIEKNYGIENQADRDLGRFPANLIHDGSDEVVSLFPNSKSTGGKIGGGYAFGKENQVGIKGNPGFGDSGSASRFFYCAKASKSERNRGCEGLEEKKPSVFDFRPTLETNRENWATPIDETPYGRGGKMKNNHPTVKPIALMEYLVKLVSREGAIVLDPFAGSGSTLVACKTLSRKYIGCEREEDYVKIINSRLESNISDLHQPDLFHL